MMKSLKNHLIGVDQGDLTLFSEFENGGDMWTGEGDRERRQRVDFTEPFRVAPTIQVSVSMWDVDSAAALRAELVSENVDPEGFDVVFRTWSDTKIARIRVNWLAIGELSHEDDWEIE